MKPVIDNLPPDSDGSFNPGTVHRRVEITIEREVVSVEYVPVANVTAWCEQCGKDVLMLTAEAAAVERNISPREIYRWLDEDKLHFQESPGGTVFICSESLAQFPPSRHVSSGESR
jgi:hypothetical protein